MLFHSSKRSNQWNIPFINNATAFQHFHASFITCYISIKNCLPWQKNKVVQLSSLSLCNNVCKQLQVCQMVYNFKMCPIDIFYIKIIHFIHGFQSSETFNSFAGRFLTANRMQPQGNRKQFNCKQYNCLLFQIITWLKNTIAYILSDMYKMLQCHFWANIYMSHVYMQWCIGKNRSA